MARQRKVIIALALLGLASFAFAGELVQTVTFDANEIAVTRRDGYDRIELKGCPASGPMGAPRLPHLMRALAIPAGAAISGVEIISADEKELAGTYDVIPAQRPVPLPMPGRTFKTEPPLPDPSIYGRDALYPVSQLRALGTGSICGYRIRQVALDPLRYNPVTKKLYFSASITFRVRYDENQARSTIPTQYQKDLFEQQARALVANPGDVGTFAPAVRRSAPSKSLPAGEYRCIAISCSTSFDSIYSRLADWKTRKGMRDTVISRDWIYTAYSGYDNAEKVRNFIRDARDNWGTAYVLLGGQGDDRNAAQNQILCRHAHYMTSGEGIYADEDYIPSDLYYSDLDGSWDLNGNHVWGEIGDGVDLYPDVFVGRAPARTRAQAQNFVNKVLAYEKSPPGGYLKKMLLPTAILWDTAYGDPFSYEERDEQRAIAAMTPSGWIDDSLFERNGTLSQAAVTASINAGRGLGHWVGHGNETGVYMKSGPAYASSSTADAYTNGNKQGIAISLACFSGAMDEVSGSTGDCCAEHLVNRVGGGLVAAMMNSRYGWGGVSDLIDTTFYSVMLRPGPHRLGEVLAATKAAWVPEAQAEGGGGAMRWCLYELNLFGDPELPLWTDEPETLSVAYTATVPVGRSDLAVAVTGKTSSLPVAGALVCAMTKSKSVYVCGTTDASGHAALSIYPAGEDTLFITVTARDKLPSEGYALARQASGPYISYLKYGCDDATGNNDGIINPGETIHLPLWIKNFGTAGSDGAVACTLSTSGQATVTDSIHDYGALAAGDSALYSPGFSFAVSPSCTNATVLPLAVRCHDASTGWIASFSLTVGAPVLSFTGRAIGGDGLLDPGSTKPISVTLKNSGLGNAYNIHGTLRCSGNAVAVIDSDAAFGTALHGSSVNNGSDTFTVAVGSGCAVGDSVFFTLTVRSDGAPDVVIGWWEYIGDTRYTAAGADGYYAVEDSDAVTRHPVYQWIETRGSGTQVVPGDDGSVSVALPFNFTWYGTCYDTITISGNGWVGLGMVASTGFYEPHQHLPTSAGGMPRPAVFAQWADLDPTSAGAWVGYRYDAAQQRFVVQFDSVPYYGTTTRNAFEIVFYDSTGDDAAGCISHDVVFQYKHWSDLGSSGIGIQDASGAKGLDVYFNGGAGNSGKLLGFYSGKAIRYTMNPGTGLTGVAVPAALPALPQTFALLRNSPNPFRNMTAIRFQAPSLSMVDLQVYNVAGQLVKTLIHGETTAGIHAIVWDGRDETGRAVASGVYLYRLASPGYSRTGKLSLVR